MPITQAFKAPTSLACLYSTEPFLFPFPSHSTMRLSASAPPSSLLAPPSVDKCYRGHRRCEHPHSTAFPFVQDAHPKSHRPVESPSHCRHRDTPSSLSLFFVVLWHNSVGGGGRKDPYFLPLRLVQESSLEIFRRCLSLSCRSLLSVSSGPEPLFEAIVQRLTSSYVPSY
jgi:hypothetical protein